MSGFPDKYQKKVIEHRGRPLVVVAGPGSGKTRTLVERARAILAVDPNSSIVFVTFTRTSRRDTQRKLEEVLAKNGKTRRADFPRVSTLHGFAKSIVHKAPRVAGLDLQFSVLVPDKEQKLILEEILEDLSLAISGVVLRKAIASKRNTGIPEIPAGMEATELAKAIQHYEELCCFYNAVDIEGLVNAAAKIIKEGKLKLPTLYFHADEYQDLNLADQQFVRELLASGPHETVAVGDDDQSIYGFRHARPEGIRELFKDKQWERVIFRRSHRLPSHILRASQALIQLHHGPRLDKRIKIPDDDGRRVLTFTCTTEEIEVEFIASLIKKGKNERKKDGEGLRYSDFMILCPTRAISAKFVKLLKEKWGIPVRKIAPRSIPDDLWRILLVLRMAERDDNLALRQWLDVLEIPHSQVKQLRDAAIGKKTTLFEVVRKSTDKTLRRFMKELDALRKTRKDIPSLLRKTKALAGVSTLPFEAEAESLPSLISELYEEYGLLESEDPDTKTDEVLVTTLHSSKGLEAEVVFIVQLSNRYIPNPAHDQDEELRVLYVGMTRAKQELYLSCPYVFDQQKGYKLPSLSPFLELIKAHLSIQRVSRSKRQKK